MANIGRRGAQLCARLGNVFVWIYHVALWPLLRATRRLVASASPSGWHTKEPRVMAARATRTTKTLPQLFEVRRNPGDLSSLLVFFFGSCRSEFRIVTSPLGASRKGHLAILAVPHHGVFRHQTTQKILPQQLTHALGVVILRLGSFPSPEGPCGKWG